MGFAKNRFRFRAQEYQIVRDRKTKEDRFIPKVKKRDKQWK